jgi:hypothetical protein
MYGKGAVRIEVNGGAVHSVRGIAARGLRGGLRRASAPDPPYEPWGAEGPGGKGEAAFRRSNRRSGNPPPGACRLTSRVVPTSLVLLTGIDAAPYSRGDHDRSQAGTEGMDDKSKDGGAIRVARDRFAFESRG